MRIRMPFGLIWLLPVLLFGCKKAEPLESRSLERFITYDINTYSAELLPSGGYVLQCMDEQDGHLSFAQFLNSDGGMAGRITYSALPRTIDGLTFDDKSILIRDLVPLANGNHAILGFGLDSLVDGTVALHLLLYKVDRHGNPTAEPFRQLVTTDSYIQYARSATDDTVAILKPHVLGVELVNNDLAAAVLFRLRGAPKDSIAVIRLPMGSSNLPTSKITIGPSEGNLELSQNRLWEFQSRETASDQLVLLSGSNDPVLTEFDLGAENIATTGSGRLLGGARMMSHFLAQDQNNILAGGIVYRTTPTGSAACPFFSTVADVSNLGDPDRYFFLDTLAPLNSPIQCFAGTWWNGYVALLTNTYRPEVSSLQLDFFTYFNDTENDLGLLLVSPNDGRIIEQRTIVSGRGMRATNLFNVNGRLVCIGVQNAFYNSGARRTFFTELNAPGQ
jgi:hypothetical protein